MLYERAAGPQTDTVGVGRSYECGTVPNGPIRTPPVLFIGPKPWDLYQVPVPHSMSHLIIGSVYPSVTRRNYFCIDCSCTLSASSPLSSVRTYCSSLFCHLVVRGVPSGSFCTQASSPLTAGTWGGECYTEPYCATTFWVGSRTPYLPTVSAARRSPCTTCTWDVWDWSPSEYLNGALLKFWLHFSPTRLIFGHTVDGGGSGDPLVSLLLGLAKHRSWQWAAEGSTQANWLPLLRAYVHTQMSPEREHMVSAGILAAFWNFWVLQELLDESNNNLVWYICIFCIFNRCLFRAVFSQNYTYVYMLEMWYINLGHDFFNLVFTLVFLFSSSLNFPLLFLTSRNMSKAVTLHNYMIFNIANTFFDVSEIDF